ncbi:hypothetical protein D3C87_1409560 [compost metagenome]
MVSGVFSFNARVVGLRALARWARTMAKVSNRSVMAVFCCSLSPVSPASRVCCKSSSTCQIQAAVPTVRPRNGNAALKINQPACLKVSQRFFVLDTDCRCASSISALTFALYKAAR